jgi:hypothetical protein
MSTLPWTKREIIDTAATIYRQPTYDDLDRAYTWPGFKAVAVFAILALGKPGGRFPPAVEHELWYRIGRVWEALREGCDPHAAYEVPLPHERPLTTGDQLDPEYRRAQEMFDKIDREQRAKSSRG